MAGGGMDKVIMGAVGGIIVGFIIGYAVNYSEPEGEGDSADAAAVAAAGSSAPVDIKPVRKMEATPAKGADSPKVIIQEVSDFQCPFCSKAAATPIQVMNTYPEDVKVEFLHNPLSFHKDAKLAAQASMAAARQGKFWEYHDTLFANAKALKEDNLHAYAEELGLDLEKFKKDIKDPEIIKKIEADQSGAVSMGATGTPAFFINGIKLTGAKPFEEFKKIVDAEIKKADAKLAAGHPADNVAYALMAENDKKVFDLFVRNLPSAKAPEKPAEVWNLTVRGDETMKGNTKDPLVTIVEFSEFQCPFCSKIVPTVKEVMDEFGDEVRFVFKHNPLSFHKQAELASVASLAANAQGKFWEYHDVLFENQKALERDSLITYAEQVGLDMERFKADLDNPKFLEHIKADQADAASVKATGTPTVFINGKKMEGGREVADFKAAIEREKKAAQKFLDKGIAKAKVYDEFVKDGKVHKELDDKVNSFVHTGQGTLGKAPAKITITEFSDFQCPFCSRVGGPLKELKERYGADVAIEFKHFPLSFHKEAHLASQASLAADEQGKFWEYHDLLFQNQKALKRPDLDLYAEQIGLDMDKFKSALDSGKFKAQVDKDMAEGQRSGVRGTPSVYINGRKYSPSGGYTADSMAATIEKFVLNK